jgi:hypothetical protein
MSPRLADVVAEMYCEIPMYDGGGYVGVPVHEWSTDHVREWIATVEGGRFAQLALPPGLDGKSLLKLSTLRLSELFEGTMRQSRAENEGSSWTVGADAGVKLGRQLFAALRRTLRGMPEADTETIAEMEEDLEFVPGTAGVGAAGIGAVHWHYIDLERT